MTMDETREATTRGRALPIACCPRRGGVAVAAVLAIVGTGFASQALTLTFGDLGLPGPGFFPFVLGVLMVALAAAIFVMTLREPTGPSRVALGHFSVLVTASAMVVTAALFERLGALISLGGFSAVMLVFVAGVRIAPAVLASGLGMLAVWYVFKVLLGVQLPLGPLAGAL
jgi:hypothetical protein